MGTTWTAKIADCRAADCGTALRPLLQRRLDELNGIFSHYDGNSELSRFNDHSGSDWFDVSAELVEVVQLARAISDISGGAFDMTVAPAVDAWGFGSLEPGATDAKPIQVTGYRQLDARSTPPALRKKTAELRINASAIAKGYAVDQLAYLLEGEGYRNYLVEIGGEVRTAGTRPDGTPWRIGIEMPDSLTTVQPTIEFVVLPGDMAVASSGDYRNYYIRDGKRISHTIDPATAAPVTNAVGAVSVIAPSAAQADALATAMMVLGDEKGMALAEREQLAVMFTLREDDRLRTLRSAAFTTYLLGN